MLIHKGKREIKIVEDDGKILIVRKGGSKTKPGFVYAPYFTDHEGTLRCSYHKVPLKWAGALKTTYCEVCRQKKEEWEACEIRWKITLPQNLEPTGGMKSRRSRPC